MPIVAGDIVYNIGGNMGPLQSALTATRKSVVSLGPAFKATGVAMSAMGVVVTGALVKSVKQAAAFEQAIANAGSVTGKTGNEFEIAKDKMSELAKTLGKTTVFSASQAAGAFYDLSSKGFDVAAMSLEELQPLLDLAAATQSDLTFTTETLTSTMRGFGLQNADAGRIADVFSSAIGGSAATMEKLSESMKYVAPVAKAANITFEETTSMLGQLYNAGLQGSQAGTSLRMMFGEILNPSEKFRDTLERLNIPLDKFTDTNLTAMQRLQMLKDAGFSAADSMEVFGDRAGPAGIILMDNADAAQAFTDKLYGAAGAAGTMADQQLDTLSGALALLRSAVEGVVISIGDALIPKIRAIVETIAPTIQAIGDWMDENQALTATVVQIVSAIGTFMVIVGPLLILIPMIAAGISMIGPAMLIVIPIIAALGVAFVLLRGIIATLYEKVVENWTSIRDTITAAATVIWGALSYLANQIAVAFHAVFDAVARAFEWFRARYWDDVRERLGVFVDWLKEKFFSMQDWFVSVWERIKEAFVAAGVWIDENWESIETAFNSAIVKIKEALVAMWNAVVWLWGGLKTVFAAMVPFVKDVWDSLAGHMKAGANGSVSYLMMFWQNIKWVVGFVVDVFMRFVGWLGNNWDQISRIFALSIGNIINTINLFAQIINTVFQVATTLMVAFAKGVGMAWREVGGDMETVTEATDALGTSFLDTMQWILSTLDKYMPKIQDYIKRFGDWIYDNKDTIAQAWKEMFTPAMEIIKWLLDYMPSILGFVSKLLHVITAIGKFGALGWVKEAYGTLMGDGDAVPAEGKSKGGVIKGGNHYTVGEQGPELFLPDDPRKGPGLVGMHGIEKNVLAPLDGWLFPNRAVKKIASVVSENPFNTGDPKFLFNSLASILKSERTQDASARAKHMVNQSFLLSTVLRSIPRALGGPVSAGQSYLVGEKGPELIVPRQPGQVMTASQTAAIASGGGGGINISGPLVQVDRVDATNAADVNNLATRMGEELQRLMQGGGRQMSVGVA